MYMRESAHKNYCNMDNYIYTTIYCKYDYATYDFAIITRNYYNGNF